jgi:hypothetical protein
MRVVLLAVMVFLFDKCALAFTKTHFRPNLDYYGIRCSRLTCLNPNITPCHKTLRNSRFQMQLQLHGTCPTKFFSKFLSSNERCFPTTQSTCPKIEMLGTASLLEFQDATSPEICPAIDPSDGLDPSPCSQDMATMATPGPRRLPLLGHLLHFLWHGDLAEMLTSLAARHGPVAVASLLGRPIYFVSDPVLVREVFYSLPIQQQPIYPSTHLAYFMIPSLSLKLYFSFVKKR